MGAVSILCLIVASLYYMVVSLRCIATVIYESQRGLRFIKVKYILGAILCGGAGVGIMVWIFHMAG